MADHADAILPASRDDGAQGHPDIPRFGGYPRVAGRGPVVVGYSAETNALDDGIGSMSALVNRLRGALSLVYREALKFGAVGGVAYVVDTYVFNVLRSGWWPLHEAPLDHKVTTCKVISATVATVVAWIGNRYWTFRHRRRLDMRREFILFAIMNVAGILIAVACLSFSHYALGLKSPLADNISANVVGLGLGTLFRFWAYRTFVFRNELEAEEAETSDEEGDTVITVPLAPRSVA